MPEFGRKSRKHMGGAAISLKVLFEEVVREYDCSVLCGYRNRLEQEKAFKTGTSKVTWPQSKHNSVPSTAIDVAPWIPERGFGQEIPWPQLPKEWDKFTAETKREIHEYAVNWTQFGHFVGYVKAVSERLGIKVRTGLDWDGDMNITDESFHDAPHFELVEDNGDKKEAKEDPGAQGPAEV